MRLKWVDTNKGDEDQPAIRARLVCMEFRRKGTDAVFSATPPLESLRLLLTIAASEPPSRTKDPLRMYVADVSRAHFYAEAVREVYIELPKEDPRSQDPDAVGRLSRTMYGTLDAAERWGLHYTAKLLEAGFLQGQASPCLFRHPVHHTVVLVHGDDFIAVGRKKGARAHLEHAEETLRDQGKDSRPE